MPTPLPQAGSLGALWHSKSMFQRLSLPTKKKKKSWRMRERFKKQENNIEKKQNCEPLPSDLSQVLFVAMLRMSPTQFRVLPSVFLRIPHSVTRYYKPSLYTSTTTSSPWSNFAEHQNTPSWIHVTRSTTKIKFHSSAFMYAYSRVWLCDRRQYLSKILVKKINGALPLIRDVFMLRRLSSFLYFPDLSDDTSVS